MRMQFPVLVAVAFSFVLISGASPQPTSDLPIIFTYAMQIEPVFLWMTPDSLSLGSSAQKISRPHFKMREYPECHDHPTPY